jgi:hypothetical protein
MGNGRELRPLLAADSSSGRLAAVQRRLMGVDGCGLVLAERRSMGLGYVPLRFVVLRRDSGMGLDPGHGLGARLGHMALQQRLHRLGSLRATPHGHGAFILHVHRREQIQRSFPTK